MSQLNITYIRVSPEEKRRFWQGVFNAEHAKALSADDAMWAINTPPPPTPVETATEAADGALKLFIERFEYQTEERTA